MYPDNPYSCSRKRKGSWLISGIISLVIAFIISFTSCTEEPKAKPDISKQTNEPGIPDRFILAHSEQSKSFAKNYCDRQLFEQLADSVTNEPYWPKQNPLHNAIYFYKKLWFVTDTFCYNTLNIRTVFFKNSVRMDGCVYRPNDYSNDVRFYGMRFDSSFYIQTFDITTDFGFTDCHFKDQMTFSLTWADTAYKAVSFVHCTFDKCLTLQNWSYPAETIYQPVYAGNVFFDKVKFNNNLDISHLTFLGNINFQYSILPDTINLIGSTFKGEIRIGPSRDGKKVTLLVGSDFPMQNLKCPASSYNIAFDTSVSKSGQEYLLSQSVELQKKIGSSLDIEKADIDLKNFKASQGDLLLQMHKFLWNYGYDKALLIKRILFCFVVFFVLNLFLFKILIREVYNIPNLQAEYDQLKSFQQRKARYYKLPTIVFLYSSIIFFGWKMDLYKFSFKHLFLSLYVFFFYILGLVLFFYFIGLIVYR